MSTSVQCVLCCAVLCCAVLCCAVAWHGCCVSCHAVLCRSTVKLQKDVSTETSIVHSVIKVFMQVTHNVRIAVQTSREPRFLKNTSCSPCTCQQHLKITMRMSRTPDTYHACVSNSILCFAICMSTSLCICGGIQVLTVRISRHLCSKSLACGSRLVRSINTAIS